MTTPQFITLGNRKVVSTANICSMERKDKSVLFQMSDNEPPISDTYDSIYLAGQAFDRFLAILTLTGIMQTLYGDEDTPTSNPTDQNSPAIYRGRLHNTCWMWDTDRKEWWPVKP